MANAVHVGPWGGNGGAPWIFTTNGGRITSVTLSSHGTSDNLAIASLEFTYTDKDNNTYRSGLFGRLRNNVQTYSFAEGEDLIEVTGTFGIWSSMTVITSLTFKTNNKVYGPYGTESGSRFTLPLAKGKFEGLFGNSGDIIDSIGGVLVP